MDEWDYAKSLAESDPAIFRIPIVLRPCAWQDVLGDDDVKALPDEGKPITAFDDLDTGWHQVYEGIKRVLEHLRTQFSPKPEFLKTIEETEFLSQDHLSLRDLYVFPTMTYINLATSNDTPGREIVATVEEVFEVNRNLIYGADLIGKTALARYLYLTLIDRRNLALFLDLNDAQTSAPSRLCRRAFNEQVTGDYSEWLNRKDKTLIVDNLSSRNQSLNLVKFAKEHFSKIIVVTNSDIFLSFFQDEPLLSDFRTLKLEPFSHVQQEQLIRRRVELANDLTQVTDGLVDELERHVDSIILSRRILPRYPFYILAILQTREAYMPGNMAITSYGDCYQALIVANLVQAGVPEHDIGTCLNFAEQLALSIYNHRNATGASDFDLHSFVIRYQKRFLLRESLVSRLKDPAFGIIREDASFKSNYMYYFFLGRFLSHRSAQAETILDVMCASSHREAHYLTLLFTIHHTNDQTIIDDILRQTKSSLDSFTPATLNLAETRQFSDIISALPEAILSTASVPESRRDERARRDDLTQQIDNAHDDDEMEDEHEIVNGIYMILKNNKIMGQVLRNRYGTLEKTRIEEIVEVIADSGLRLVNFLLVDEDQIVQLARYYNEKDPAWDLAMIRRALTMLSFVWTMINVEEIVGALSVPDIDESVDAVVMRKNTPAYDIVGYFRKLDSARRLTRSERNALASLLKRNKDAFVQRVVSMRTQHYMNTHESAREIEQSICDLLRIRYARRLLSES